MLLPNLTRLPQPSATLESFHGHTVPADWSLPRHLWVTLSRSTMVLDAFADLMARSIALLEAGDRYVMLVNARADWLFKRDEAGLQSAAQRRVAENSAWMEIVGGGGGDGGEESRQLNLLLRTGAATGWDVEYWRAREVLEAVMGEFADGLEEGRFMQLAKVLCPSGEGRRALEEWFDGTVGELLDVAPGWLLGGFTLRETLREVSRVHGEVRILVDCLDEVIGGEGRSGRTSRPSVRLQRRQLFDLRYGSLTPLCKLVWVTEGLANRIMDADEGVGPIS